MRNARKRCWSGHIRWIGFIAISLTWWITLNGGCAKEVKPPCGNACPKGQGCDLKTKKCRPIGCNTCQEDVDCNNGEICNARGCCAPGSNPQDGGSGPKDAGPTERTQPDSTPDAQCTTPPCNRRCDDNSQCTDSTQPFCHLIKGVCVGCRDHSDCKNGKQCVQGVCTGSSDRCKGVQCGTGKKCCPNDGACHACCTDKDCSQGTCTLENGARVCKTSSVCTPACLSGNVCDPVTQKCTLDCRITGCTDATKLCDKSTGVCTKKDCRSNYVCPAGETCNNATGQCEQPKNCVNTPSLCQNGDVCNPVTKLCEKPKTCVTTPSMCRSPQCCDKNTGKCVTHCRTCGCPTGRRCNFSTGVCQVATCKAKSRCSSSADCCGRKCKATTGGLGPKRCTCSSSSQCASPYRCKTNFFTKYCQ